MTQNCSRHAKEKNRQTKGDGYITFCPAKGIFKRKIKYAPGIDGADTEMNAYGRCCYKPTVFHNRLPITMIGPSFARPFFACALSWVGPRIARQPGKGCAPTRPLEAGASTHPATWHPDARLLSEASLPFFAGGRVLESPRRSWGSQRPRPSIKARIPL